MKWLLTVFFTACFIPGFGQKYVISNPKANVVYLGIPNPLDVAVEGKFCRDLDISTDNGKLEITESCSYNLLPQKAGKAEITIRYKKSNEQKVIGIVTFRVKYLPDPIAVVGGKSGGEIRKNVLTVQTGIAAVLNGFDFDVKFKIFEYAVAIFRDSQLIFNNVCKGPLFSKEVIDAFETSHVNDKIIFSGIKCVSADGMTRILDPIEFRIIE